MLSHFDLIKNRDRLPDGDQINIIVSERTQLVEMYGPRLFLEGNESLCCGVTIQGRGYECSRIAHVLVKGSTPFNAQVLICKQHASVLLLHKKLTVMVRSQTGP